MRKILNAGGVAALIVAACALSIPAQAGVGEFLGSWKNIDPWTKGVTRIDVTPAGPEHVYVRVWGECHPTDCDWGSRPAREFTAGVGSDDVRTLVAEFNPGFAEEMVILRRAPSGDLRFEVLTHFTDGSGRRDYSQAGRLAHW